ncbi:MAG: hypothetical protein KDC98_03855, partial [Planctomycetes bacterium]|nr:hypothetical protein [Planctomycetota bacterium]
MDHRRTGWAAVVLSVAIGAMSAQQPIAEQDPKKLMAAVAKWLDSQHDSEELLDATVEAVLAEQTIGLAHLGSLLTMGTAEPDAPRTKGTKQLATRVALAFLQRESSSSVVYAGQYDPLAPLQPFVGELFFSWLIDTPSWFPDTHRITLVPALRDLQPKLPGRTRLEGVLALVANKDIEPEDLRSALECMLWQWGKKEFVKPRIDELIGRSTEGETEERALALLELADLYYALREYKLSAATHRSLQSLAASTGFELKPVDWYSAACVHALTGQIELGIEALARCAELQASADVDSSHKVEAEVFDKDP